MTESGRAEHDSPEPSAKRRRASRAGQPKRFQCAYPDCGKCYSRAEHLHRHELNHNPKEVYRCEIPNCGHTFVRPDLFARHKARHDDPNNGTPHPVDGGLDSVSPFPSQTTQAHYAHSNGQSLVSSCHAQSDTEIGLPHWTPANQPSLPTPGPSVLRGGSSPSNGFNVLAQQTAVSPELNFSINDQWDMSSGPANQASDNFAAWLFESPTSQDNEFNITDLPFLDFGLQYSPKDIWEHSSVVDNAASDRHSVSSGHTADPLEPRPSPKLISEARRTEIMSLLLRFSKKQHSENRCYTEDPLKLLYCLDDSNFPNLTIKTLDNLIANYWLSAQSQMPIIHEPTFSSNGCNVLLLLAIIALGATDLVRTKPRDNLDEYRQLAHLIMTQLRWEIFTDNDAQPPIQLWVAQALLLLEYYEKQCSTRKLHERAHIHHGTTLTLLRRGNPLVGRSDSETPPSAMPSRPASPSQGVGGEKRSDSSLHSWWLHWVRNESFCRVVFTAFQMDTLHAVLYGHAADMAPYEIRLPLPCDDSLWNATSASEVQRLDANLKMYGIRPMNFLDGLKKCLHAHDVQTHAPARMLLMSGLLSVGWHISRREKHLQFLENVPSGREQGRWRLLLLRAFSHWRDSFDSAIGTRGGNAGSKLPDFNAARAGVLFHLAHITLHVDIIDLQIFAGTKQLLGRKVSKKDFTNVISRMKTWACTPVARHAALHAYKLLCVTLNKPPDPRNPQSRLITDTMIRYNCRTDPIIFRPWAIFMAGLTIWAYQHASSLYLTSTSAQQIDLAAPEEQSVCQQYLTVCAAVEDSAQLAPVLSMQGCRAVLGVLSQNFAEADPELLHEASKRLRECKETLGTSIMSWPT